MLVLLRSTVASLHHVEHIIEGPFGHGGICHVAWSMLFGCSFDLGTGQLDGRARGSSKSQLPTMAWPHGRLVAFRPWHARPRKSSVDLTSTDWTGPANIHLSPFWVCICTRQESIIWIRLRSESDYAFEIPFELHRDWWRFLVACRPYYTQPEKKDPFQEYQYNHMADGFAIDLGSARPGKREAGARHDDQGIKQASR